MAIKNRAQFIAEAKKVHGDKYNYDLADFKFGKAKVVIVCEKHGQFLQAPIKHLSGQGCPICGRETTGIKRRLRPDVFLLRAREVHGYKYEYDMGTFVHARKKMRIICPKHGEFWQTPDKHLCGRGCPECKNDGVSERCRLPLEEFMRRAKERHGDRYTYDISTYHGGRKEMRFFCPDHGEFWRQPAVFLATSGCPVCCNKKVTTAHYLEKAQKVWGDTYDLSEVEYASSSKKIKIVCRKHGPFSMTPNNFLRGHGCPACRNEGTTERQLKTREQFIESARKKHGDKYDYSRVVYYGNKIPVEIKCKEHGIFLQKPNGHLNGAGCPKCSQSRGEEKIQVLLEREMICYVKEKAFTDCANKRPLKFDFYLPDYNLCIEYQGKQHYEPVEQFGGKEAFLDLQRRDQIKRDYCASHGIKLIEIKYNESVLKRLNEELKITA